MIVFYTRVLYSDSSTALLPGPGCRWAPWRPGGSLTGWARVLNTASPECSAVVSRLPAAADTQKIPHPPSLENTPPSLEDTPPSLEGTSAGLEGTSVGKMEVQSLIQTL